MIEDSYCIITSDTAIVSELAQEVVVDYFKQFAW